MDELLNPRFILYVLVLLITCVGAIFRWLISINNRFHKLEHDIEINTRLDESEKSKISDFIRKVDNQLEKIHGDLSEMKSDISAIKAKMP
jgi:hypothetical protein